MSSQSEPSIQLPVIQKCLTISSSDAALMNSQACRETQYHSMHARVFHTNMTRECMQQEEVLGKENKVMQRRLDEVELELSRAQRQRDSHMLHCKSLQHRLATLQDVVLLSHGHAAGLAPSARKINLHSRSHPR